MATFKKLEKCLKVSCPTFVALNLKERNIKSRFNTILNFNPQTLDFEL